MPTGQVVRPADHTLLLPARDVRGHARFAADAEAIAEPRCMKSNPPREDPPKPGPR